MREARRRRWCLRHDSCFWRHQLSAQWREYARSLSWCESRDRRYAPEAGFISFFQWTWRTYSNTASYLTGRQRRYAHADAYRASYWEQAVRAIRLVQRVGHHSAAAFPNCP